jgi:hypothetical protein
MTPGSILFTNMNNFRILSSTENITWNAINQQGSVQIWFSPDYGDTWLSISDSAANNGTYSWNTALYDDCGLGLLRILLRNTEGFIYGSAVSSPFAIDNPMNGTPFVKILNDEFNRGLHLTEDTLRLELLLADPEQSNLVTTVYYSADGGQNFEVTDILMKNSDTTSQFITMTMNTLANSNNAVIKVEATDGQLSDADQTFYFVKQSPRIASFPATKLTGDGEGLVNIHVVDPAQLTGDVYHLSFDDTSFIYKVYNIYNVTNGNYVVQNATELDGISEGPYFDGIRMLIKDYDPPAINFQLTGWQNSLSTLEPGIYLSEINIGSTTLYGVPYPADYQITIYDIISDTSSTAFGAPAVPMKFTIQNITENRAAETIFLDNDNNNQFSLADDLYFIEYDTAGNPYLTWAIFVDGGPNPVPPQAGDQFFIKTFKPFSSADLYEFTGSISPIVKTNQEPDNFRLFNNYPNPFNPTTVISWQLATNSSVRLSIYNIRGQKVKTLLSAYLLSGFHSMEFDASDFASGVYFYRLEAGPLVQTRKMVVLK